MSRTTRALLFIALMAALAIIAWSGSAHAFDRTCGTDTGCLDRPAAAQRSTTAHARHERRQVDVDAKGDPRPGRWCAWWLRRELGIPRSAFPNGSYNLARAFRRIGTAASGPGINVIVVWWHHVGIITGRSADGWIVKSGNDGHGVRERLRSLRGVIAFRRWHGGWG